MANKPKEFILSDDDAIFFYRIVFARYLEKHSKRISIEKVAKKYNIEIVFLESGKCKRFRAQADTICIYDKRTNCNKQFFQHLRNAFAHGYMEVDGNRCRVLDWNPYGVQMKGKQPFKAQLITMNGNVNYHDFKQMLEEFSSDQSLITNKSKQKS